MNEVPDEMGILESRMNEIAIKAYRLNEMTDRLEAMPTHELIIRVETLENKATTDGDFKCRDSSTGSVAQMEAQVEGLNKAQQLIVQMVLKMYEDLRTTQGAVRAEEADSNAD